MRVSEMVMLYRAIGELTPAEDVTELDDDVSLGAVFAHHLVSLKRTPFMSSAHKPETVGSLLTPIFRHCGIDTTTCSLVSKRALMDLDYLQRATWVKPGKRWVFANSQRELVTIQLPERELTRITDDPDCLRFQPDPNLVHALPPTRRRGASSRAAPSSAEDAPVRARPSSSRRSTAAAIPEPIGPHYLPEAPEIPMEPAAFQRYVVQSFQAIWNAITVVSNCGCVRPSTPPASDDE